MLPKQLSSTTNWTQGELELFQIHYYQVSDWQTYFCETSVDMTQEAKDLANLRLDIEEIIESM